MKLKEDNDNLGTYMKRFVLATPILGRGLLILYRLRKTLRHVSNPVKELVIWLFKSNEVTNFTYHLEDTNKRYLAAFLAQITRSPYRDILGYIAEVECNGDLRRHIQNATKKSAQVKTADLEVKYGRRVGWYAVVRARKPRVVVETGVDNGLGACVLTAALAKNSEEGDEGYYYGTDINPRAGYLLGGKYANFGEILFGDSIESLKRLGEDVDIFVNDSDHSAEYEAREYETMRNKLSQGALVIGDNSHATDKLLEFAERTGRQFLFFQEKPYKHWYPGAGIGVAFEKE